MRIDRSIVLSIFVATLGLVGCGAEHGGNTGSQSSQSFLGATPESIQAFESTVYNFGKTVGCVKCHGGSVNPQWLNSDPGTAYSFARPLVNMANPTASTFVIYSSNNHCNDSACRNPANSPAMNDLLLQWAAIEINQSSNGLPVSDGTTLPNPPFVTVTMPIPQNLPLITSNTRAVVRFDLSQLAPNVPKLNGAVLELSIQSYNAAGTTYKIFDPRVVGASAAVTLTGMHVYVRPDTGSGIGNEYVNQGNLWSTLNAVVPSIALPAPLPTGPMTSIAPMVGTSLAIPIQSAADVITVGFAEIR